MLQLHTWKKGKGNEFLERRNPIIYKREKIEVPLELGMDDDSVVRRMMMMTAMSVMMMLTMTLTMKRLVA